MRLHLYRRAPNPGLDRFPVRTKHRSPLRGLLYGACGAWLLFPTAWAAEFPPFDARFIDAQPRSETVLPGDWDGDGDTDLLVVHRSWVDDQFNMFPEGVAWHANTGTGADGLPLFGPPQPLLVELAEKLAPDEGASADFNGDGLPDLAVNNIIPGLEAVHVFLNLGNAQLAQGPIIPTAEQNPPWRLKAQDINGDGAPDLVFLVNRELWLLINRGSTGAGWAGFDPPRQFNVADLPDGSRLPATWIAVGDLNGDGRPDLATDGTILFQNTDGAFTPWQREGGVGDTGWIGDVNNDGTNELVIAATVWSSGFGFVSVEQWQGPGSGLVTVWTGHFDLPGNPLFTGAELAVADVTGDELPELFVATGLGVLGWLNEGDFNFTGPATLVEGKFTGPLRVLDLNGAPPPELIAPEAGTFGDPGARIAILVAQSSCKGSIAGVKFEDLDLDGQQDPGENGVGGITINLHGPGGLLATTTAADGSFGFSNLDPGAYTVEEIVPRNRFATTPTSVQVTVACNQVTEVSFGNAPIPTDIPDPEDNLALIVAIKFADLNGNGDWDRGEFGVNGVTIKVDGGPPGGQQDVTGPGLFFGPAGVAVFAVDPGQHRVDEVVPPLWTPTTPTSVVVNVASGDIAYVIFGNRPPMDWGDARQSLEPLESAQNLKWLPAGYPVTRVVHGAFHVVDPATRLGPAIDEEPNGQPSRLANGDDLNDVPDEDGVMWFGGTKPPAGTPDQPFVFDPRRLPILPHGVNYLRALNTKTGQLRVWIDFNRDGKWDDPLDPDDDAEDVFRPNTDPNDPQDDELAGALPTGPDRPDLAFLVPADAIGGLTFARVRFSTKNIPGPTGGAPDGEVEDYLVWIGEPTDFGDAPAPYPTLRSDDGARHTASLFWMGGPPDGEGDGQPDADALGDDSELSPGLRDDEDGVELLTPWAPGSHARLRVIVHTGSDLAPARLDAWADFNQDGDWVDPGERIFDHLEVWQGTNVLSVAVPPGAAVGKTFVRFRLSPDGVDEPTGPGGPGEVEDYAVEIEPVAATLSARLSGDGSEIELLYPGGLDGWRLEQAPAVTGPWTEVMTLPLLAPGQQGLLPFPRPDGPTFWRLVRP